jgi:ABC-type hemin transport system substrate-binding protein
VHRIISLLPAATEIAAALGLMDQVVGVFRMSAIFPVKQMSGRASRIVQCTMLA